MVLLIKINLRRPSQLKLTIMKTIFLAILLVLTMNFSFAQKFYYSNHQKINLSEDRNYILIVPSTDPKEYFKTVVQPVYDKYFNNYEIQNNYRLIKLHLRNISSGPLAISALKADPQTKFIWYAMYTSRGTPFVPTNEIVYKSLPNFSPRFENASSSKAEFDPTSSIARGIDNEQVFDLANQYYESGQAAWCHPNFWAPVQRSTNDPYFSSQYYLKNTGQTGGVSGIDINVESAWNISQGSSSIRVAVIDDGVESDHPDLPASRVLNGYTPLLPFGNGRPANSASSHGQSCAGIIAATKDNNIGISGIAPNVSIVPINIFVGGESTADMAAAINYAWGPTWGNADVISNSWYVLAPWADNIEAAINNAVTQGRGGKGAIVVFSTGNEGEIEFPAYVPGSLSVGAIDKSGNLWNYSGVGVGLGLVAPSGNTNGNGDVYTLDRAGANGSNGGDYRFNFGGTSAAAPQVAGVAALMLSANPNLYMYEVYNCLTGTADDMGAPGYDYSFGYGRVNARKALCCAIGANYSLGGPSTICMSSSNQAQYNIYPLGATISWQVTGITGATVVQHPTNPNAGIVTVPIGVTQGTLTLTATVAGACNSPLTQTIQVSNGPTANTQVPFWTQNGNTNYMNNCNKIVEIACTGKGAGDNFISPCSYVASGYVTDNSATSITWSKVGGPANSHFGWFSNQNNFSVYCPINYPNDWITLRCTAANSCGSGYRDYTFYMSTWAPPTAGCYTAEEFAKSATGVIVSPNPSPGKFMLTLTTADKSAAIKEVIIKNKMGIAIYQQRFKNEQKKQAIDLSNQPSDIYMVQIFDGKQWITEKLSLQK